jgi:hypothetical protein
VLFDEIVPVEDVWPVQAHWPRRRTESLIARFRTSFPQISYDVFWETRLLNAQAFIVSSGRCVRIYGGLARHCKIGIEGLAFALAHETGHHLAGPPYHPFYSCISSEERANEWAVDEGLTIIFGEAVASRYANRGRDQIDALSSSYSLNSVI